MGNVPISTFSLKELHSLVPARTIPNVNKDTCKPHGDLSARGLSTISQSPSSASVMDSTQLFPKSLTGSSNVKDGKHLFLGDVRAGGKRLPDEKEKQLRFKIKHNEMAQTTIHETD